MIEIFSSIILMAMGTYGVILYSTNKLGLYIHPRFFEESFIASIFALVIGTICFIYFLIKQKNEFKALKTILNKKIALIILLIFLSFYINTLFLIIAGFIVFAPDKSFNKLLSNNVYTNLLAALIVILGLSLPAKGLSSVTASQRSVDLNSINLTQNTISAVENFNKSTTNYSLGDWIAMIGFNPDPQFYKDKEVKMTGFIYRPDNVSLKENQVLVARFVITCCAVDARPIGLVMTVPEGSEAKNDQWIEVNGKFDIDEKNNIFINTTSFQEVEQPSNPYIF